MDYSERLHVPLRWWVQGTMLVATFWLALAVSMDEYLPVVWTMTGALLLAMAGAFQSYGARIKVRDGVLQAGKAHIPLTYVGEVEALDAVETRRVAGVDADARAHLLLRPYLKRSVKVQLTDPDDPTPYWLLHTRHPEELAAALTAASDTSAALPR